MQLYAGEITSPMIDASGPDATLSSFLENYIQFRGYSTRPEFWWPFLFLILVHTAIGMTAIITISTLFAEDMVTDARDLLGVAGFSPGIWLEGFGAVFAAAILCLHLLIAALTVIPLLALTWRRLHDSGLPGSMSLLGLIPLVGWLVLLLLLARPSAPQKHRPEFSAAWY